jgi:hypothetical protein
LTKAHCAFFCDQKNHQSKTKTAKIVVTVQDTVHKL